MLSVCTSYILFQELRRRLANITKDAYYYISKSDALKSVGAQIYILSEKTFPDDNLSKCQGILTKLGTCIDIKDIWFWIANGQISSMFDRVICP